MALTRTGTNTCMQVHFLPIKSAIIIVIKRNNKKSVDPATLLYSNFKVHGFQNIAIIIPDVRALAQQQKEKKTPIGDFCSFLKLGGLYDNTLASSGAIEKNLQRIQRAPQTVDIRQKVLRYNYGRCTELSRKYMTHTTVYPPPLPPCSLVLNRIAWNDWSPIILVHELKINSESFPLFHHNVKLFFKILQ